jgi:putative membrane protein
MKKLIGCLALLGGCAWVSLPADAQTEKGGAAGDAEFVKMAASGGMLEVKTSEMAQRQASSQEVRKFSKHMLVDHTKANNELKQLAARKGWRLPNAMVKKHADLTAKVGAARGKAFDDTYMEVQVAAHEEAVDLFRKQSQQGKDAELKEWATRTLPTLEKHLKMAKEIHQGKAGGSKDRR